MLAKKKITAKTSISPLATAMTSIFFVAGLVVIAFRFMKRFSNPETSDQEFLISILLGSLLVFIFVYIFRGQLKEKSKIEWLNQNGLWIKAKVVKIRVVFTNKMGRCEAFVIALEAAPEEKIKYGLDDFVFESDTIYSLSLPEDYQQQEYDIVIDPEAPKDRYFVNLDVNILFRRS